VIDGLDECDDKVLMADFVKAVIKAAKELHQTNLRILLASTPSEHIQQQLNDAKIRHLDLEGFDATNDIHKFFQDHFSDMYKKNRQIVPKGSWPSNSDFHMLSGKCQGSFIVAVTLMSIMVKSGHPIDKLREILSMDAVLLEEWKKLGGDEENDSHNVTKNPDQLEDVLITAQSCES
jgi:hypothetical protein